MGFAAYAMIFATNLLLGGLATRFAGSAADIVAARAGNLSFFQAQIPSRLGDVSSIGLIIGIGVLISQIRDRARARLALLIIGGTLTMVMFALFANRGPGIIVLTAGSYVSIVAWRGNLISGRTFIGALCLGLMTLHLLDIGESLVPSGRARIGIATLFTSLEPQIFENTGRVILLVKNGEPLRVGAQYLEAMKGILPTQVWGYQIVSLDVWLIQRIAPGLLEQGYGFAFGAAAEGYLAGKLVAVFVHGLVGGGLGILIRWFKSFATFGPFFYAASIGMIYKFIRTDSVAIVSRIEWMLIIVILLVIIVQVLSSDSRRSGRTPTT